MANTLPKRLTNKFHKALAMLQEVLVESQGFLPGGHVTEIWSNGMDVQLCYRDDLDRVVVLEKAFDVSGIIGADF